MSGSKAGALPLTHSRRHLDFCADLARGRHCAPHGLLPPRSPAVAVWGAASIRQYLCGLFCASSPAMSINSGASPSFCGALGTACRPNIASNRGLPPWARPEGGRKLFSLPSSIRWGAPGSSSTSDGGFRPVFSADGDFGCCQPWARSRRSGGRVLLLCFWHGPQIFRMSVFVSR